MSKKDFLGGLRRGCGGLDGNSTASVLVVWEADGSGVYACVLPLEGLDVCGNDAVSGQSLILAAMLADDFGILA